MDTHSDHTTISILPGKGDYLLTALIATIIYIASIYRFGPGVTFDSVNYLNAASTIEEGMKKTDGTPFYDWPPLFPTVLSISHFTNTDIITFAEVLHGIVYVLNILITLFLLKQNLKNKYLLIIASTALLFSLPLLQVHVLIWSEPIFILLLLINLIIAKEYINTGSINSLIKLIVVSILFFLERKSGIYFILSNTVIIILIRKPQWLKHSIIYLLISSLPVLIWFLRKNRLSGKFFGSAEWEPEKVLVVLKQFINAFGSHFIPTPLPISIKLIFLISTSVLLFFISKKILVKNFLKNNKILMLAFFYTFTYYILLILSLFYLNLSEEIDDRILSPAYLFLFLSIFLFLDLLIQKLNLKYTLTLLIIVSVWTTYPIIRTSYNIKKWNKIGTGGYNRIYWQENLIIKELSKKDLKEDILLTNDINALIYYLNFRNNKKLKILPDSSSAPVGKSFLVCVSNNWNLQEEECLSDKWKNKKIIVSNKDGKIWEIN